MTSQILPAVADASSRLLLPRRLSSEAPDETCSSRDDNSTRDPFVHSLDHGSAWNPKALESVWEEAQFVALIMTLSWLLTPSLKPPSSVVNTGQLLGNRELTNKMPVILEGKNKDVI